MSFDIEENSGPLGIARGLLAGVSPVRVFGRNPAVGATFIPVAPSTVDLFRSGALTGEIVSTSEDDKVGGTGARIVRCLGLDANGGEVQVDSDLDGTTPVPITEPLLRLNAGLLPRESVGTYGGSNIGEITISLSGVPIGIIQPGVGVTHNGIYTIPKGKTGYLIGAAVSASSAQRVDFRLCIRLGIDKIDDPFNPMLALDQVDGVITPVSLLADSYLKLPELTDVWIDAEASTPAAASARFDVYLVDNANAIQSTFT